VYSVSTRETAAPQASRVDDQACRIAGGNRDRINASVRADAVTVITVCFNSVRTIERTIDSIKAQTHPTTEYIVIDGGSTDGTVDVLRRRDSDINMWISEPDRGISDAFNKGIALASGQYLAFVNSDDWLEPNHLRTAVSELHRTSADYVFGDLELHDPNGQRLHFFVGDAGYRTRISHHMPFLNHPTVVCRRTAFDKIGVFDTSLGTAMDYDWFLRLHNAGGIGHYSPQLVAHMTLEGQSDRNFTSALREVREVSIRNGYPSWLAWTRFIFRLYKGHLRRRLQNWLPTAIYEKLRERINVNYRRGDDRPS